MIMLEEARKTGEQMELNREQSEDLFSKCKRYGGNAVVDGERLTPKQFNQKFAGRVFCIENLKTVLAWEAFSFIGKLRRIAKKEASLKRNLEILKAQKANRLRRRAR